MKRRPVTSILLILLATLFSFHAQRLGNNASAQRRKSRVRSAPSIRKQASDFSKFSHATKEHKEACKTCHKTPTANWQKAREFPDVADYPDHDACVRCHRPQFFKGVQPVICTVCHVKTSPRDDARLPFRDPTRPRQFTIEFPHDKHQDVIALLRRQPDTTEQGARVSFVKAAHVLDDKPKKYNNCEICHAANSKTPVSPATGWVDGYVPPVDSFKTTPDSHASCFNCHWSGQQPIRNDCGDCHKFAAAPFFPVAFEKRKSMKFRHEGGGEKRTHAVPPTECTVCHINITKATTLEGLKIDVPITSCTECHNKGGLRQDLNKELRAIDKDKSFVCSYCHTSNVGGLDPPRSHYIVAERRPMRRKDLK